MEVKKSKFNILFLFLTVIKRSLHYNLIHLFYCNFIALADGEMSTEEINNLIDAWNPMQDDYKNAQFNQYSVGPVAGLHGSQQRTSIDTGAAAMLDKNNIQSVPYLVLKNVPKNLSKRAIYNLCSQYGKVADIKINSWNPNAFIHTPSIADMEAIYRGLLNNNYGMVVLVGKHLKSTKSRAIYETAINDDTTSTFRERPNIDIENRTYIASDKQHPRPQVPQPLDTDAHTLEREGINKPISNSKYEYCTGRAITKISEKAKMLIKIKNEQSAGTYIASDNVYTNCDSMPNFESGPCQTCQRQCDTVCLRCSAYYCNTECQKMDWPQHRHICGKEKLSVRCELIKNELELTTELALKRSADLNVSNSNVPSSGDIVQLLSISTPNVVFVRSRTTDIDYFKIINYLQIVGKTLKPLKHAPKFGEIVIALHKNQFNRAQVLNVRDEQQDIVIHHIDYGTLDYVKIEKLFSAPETFARIPRHAIPVLLKDVPDCYMTDAIRNSLYSYLNYNNLRIEYNQEDYVEQKGAYLATLIDVDTKQSINEKIIKLALPVEPTTIDEICFKNYLEQKPLPTGSNIELIVIDNSLMITGSISCTTKLYAIEIQKFHKDIQRYGENVMANGYAPRTDELCIAKYTIDNKWYRGRCLELIGDGHPSVLFIDYGNIAYVHIDNIRRYPPQFTFPIFTWDCEIEGLPEICNKELVAKLEELIPNGSTIICNHVKESDNHDYYSISLPNVLTELTQQNLI